MEKNQFENVTQFGTQFCGLEEELCLVPMSVLTRLMDNLVAADFHKIRNILISKLQRTKDMKDLHDTMWDELTFMKTVDEFAEWKCKDIEEPVLLDECD